jgi:DNA-binding HxlR family transcriptional regulator
MSRDDLSEIRCSIGRAMSLVGESWSILILRDLAQGLSQYEEFRKNLGISPSMLSKRLNELTEACLIKKTLYQDNPPRYAYSLTPRGEDFLPVIATLLAFGNKHASPNGIDTQLMHSETHRRIDPIVVDERTGEPLNFKQIVFGGGPANSEKKIATLKRRNLPLVESG